MIRMVAIVLAGAVAAVVLNVVLLNRASGGNDPVGRLRPTATVPAAPKWTVRPTTTVEQDHGADGDDD